MDREERKEEELIPKGITQKELIPEAEMMDFWEEGSEYVMYDKWDRIKDWFKRVWKKIWRLLENRFWN